MEKKKLEWELLGESSRLEVDRLINYYKKDKPKAKVIWSQEKTKYTFNRIVLFKKDKKNFEICNMQVNYGFSINGIIYNRQKKISSIIYKDGKFWHNTNSGGPKFKQLTFRGLKDFCNTCYGISKEDRINIFKLMEDKFSFIRWVGEHEELWGMCFNTIIRYKLKNPNDCIRHMYGVPINIAKIVKDGPKSFRSWDGGDVKYIKVWKEIKKVLINIQNLTPELYNDHYFMDSCKMASSLGKSVNCSWGQKRLKDEHDKWSKEITAAILDYADLQTLNIKAIYSRFAEFSGYKILKTNKEMIHEGMELKHCVATYIDQVDRGDTAIYHVKGYTLQLVERTIDSIKNDGSQMRINGLAINQFNGFSNEHANTELRAEVQVLLNSFNDILAEEKRLKDQEYQNLKQESDRLEKQMKEEEIKEESVLEEIIDDKFLEDEFKLENRREEIEELLETDEGFGDEGLPF